MKIVFTDTFFNSLKKIRRDNTIPFRIYYFFKYDLPTFFKNIRLFRKALWKYRWYDSQFLLIFLRIGIEHMADKVEKRGHEVDETRLKKVAKMREASSILRNIEEDSYMELAEKQLGVEVDSTYLFEREEPEEVRENNRKIFERASKMEEEEWDKLFKILKGQTSKAYRDCKTLKDTNKVFDGTGLKTWWD